MSVMSKIEPYQEVRFEAGHCTFESLQRLADEVLRVHDRIDALQSTLTEAQKQLAAMRQHDEFYSNEVRVWYSDR